MSHRLQLLWVMMAVLLALPWSCSSPSVRVVPRNEQDLRHDLDTRDGVVEYESAHLEGVDSEIVIPSKHSCQSHPRTMIALRRILREHLLAGPTPPSRSVP